MKAIKNILVVFDDQSDNQALIDQATALAKANHALITVMDVIETRAEKNPVLVDEDKNLDLQLAGIEFIEELPDAENGAKFVKTIIGERSETLPGKDLFDIHEFFLKEELDHFERFVSTLRKAGVEVKSKRVSGIPFIEIIREVLKNQHDLVMLSAEGGEGSTDPLFGNTTMHLVRKCPCPVWVIKPGQQMPMQRILAAVDLTEEDAERAELAKHILELSVSLAQQHNAELVILHSWSLFGESVLRGRAGISEHEVDKLLAETQSAHRHLLKEVLSKVQIEGTKIQVFLLKGEAGDLIPQLTRSKDIDLLVMGTVSRGGVAGLLIGNTAEKVLPKINSSIITVKPAKFITPVKLD